MKRNELESLILEKSLSVVNGSDRSAILEYALEEGHGDKFIKNVCAKVTTKLADDVANVCAALDIRQRRFIELALIDAVQRSNAIMDQEGVWEALEGLGTPVEQESEGNKGKVEG